MQEFRTSSLSISAFEISLGFRVCGIHSSVLRLCGCLALLGARRATGTLTAAPFRGDLQQRHCPLAGPPRRLAAPSPRPFLQPTSAMQCCPRVRGHRCKDTWTPCHSKSISSALKQSTKKFSARVGLALTRQAEMTVGLLQPGAASSMLAALGTKCPRA